MLMPMIGSFGAKSTCPQLEFPTAKLLVAWNVSGVSLVAALVSISFKIINIKL